MKKIIWFYTLFVFVFIVSNSCKKNNNPDPVPPPTEPGIIMATANVNDITQTTASCGGVIGSDGGSTISARGVCWGTGQTPTIADNKTTDGTGAGTFISNLSGLNPDATYYVRAYATNSKGTGYGSTMSFKTMLLTTSAISDIKQISATCGGTISADDGSIIIERGVCWSTGLAPTIADSKTSDGTGAGSFTSSLTGLAVNTTYSVRVYATCSNTTEYGNIVSFTTSQEEIATDIDGNIYHTKTIGTQVWMVENLKVSHYRNGDPIPNVTDGTAWGNLTTGAYCDYANDAGKDSIYGKLYNWYTVGDSRNLAPSGWHVAADSDWETLQSYLGGSDIAGGKMKSIGTIETLTGLWFAPNAEATNESGFSALPAGYRVEPEGYFTFINICRRCSWWSSDNSTPGYAREWSLETEDGFLGSNPMATSKRVGYSVRCIKD